MDEAGQYDPQHPRHVREPPWYRATIVFWDLPGDVLAASVWLERCHTLSLSPSLSPSLSHLWQPPYDQAGWNGCDLLSPSLSLSLSYVAATVRSARLAGTDASLPAYLSIMAYCLGGLHSDPTGGATSVAHSFQTTENALPVPHRYCITSVLLVQHWTVPVVQQ